MRSGAPVVSMGLHELVEALPDCVLVVDSFGVIRFLNRAAEEQLGYRSTDWVGQTVFKVIDEDELRSCCRRWNRSRAKQVGTPVEVRVRDCVGHGALE